MGLSNVAFLLSIVMFCIGHWIGGIVFMIISFTVWAEER